MPLKIQKSSRAWHCRYWGHERISLARVINSTRCLCVHSNPHLLTHYNWSRLLRIWIWLKFSICPHKFMLSGWTSILAPKSFQVDSTYIASSALSTEHSVNLFEISHCKFVISLTAAAQSPWLYVIFASIEKSYFKRFTVYMKREFCLWIKIVHTSRLYNLRNDR